MARFERNPEKLLAEMSARIKVRDVKRMHELTDQLEPKWYESLFLVLLSPAAFGLLFVLIKAVESDRWFAGNDKIIARFFYIWFGVFILGLTAMLEVLLTRLRAMRRLMKELRRELDELWVRTEHSNSSDTKKS